MTDLEKRAKEYAIKVAEKNVMPKDGFAEHLIRQAYLDATKAETALLSQHIIDLQKDKGNLTDKERELEQENEQIKNSDSLCKLIGEQKLKIKEFESQIEKMKCCGNCIHCKYDENEESYEFCEKHQQVVNIAIVPCSEWKGR